MKIDLYSKVVLTVIAACLVLLTIQSLKPKPVKAAREEIINVNISTIGGSSHSAYDLREVLRIMRKDLNHTPDPRKWLEK